MALTAIDSNVLVKANGTDYSDQCMVVSRDIIDACIKGHRTVALDSLNLVMSEYSQVCRGNQSGMGSAFVKWLYQYQWEKCKHVTITPTNGHPILFDEIPTGQGIEGFDPNDQKFLAVALAAGGRCVIINATDSDWEDYRTPIEQLGVRIDSLCLS